MSKYFISADNLILANGKECITNGGVLISDSLIEWVGSISEAPNLNEAKVFHYKESSILPGLIDSHVHLSLTGTPDPWNEMQNDSVALATIKATKSALQTLQNGVTYVRDMGSKEGIVIDVAKAIDSGIIFGSRILPSGRCITMTGGHAYPIGIEVDGEFEARKAARQDLKHGAKSLKVIASGGVLTPGVAPGSPQLSIEEMKAVVDEAHKAGFLVGAHAHGTQGIKNALHANCDTIEHCSYLDEESIDLFLEKGATMVSTLIATNSLISDLKNPGVPSYVVDKIQKHAEKESQSLEKAILHRVKIIAGSDSGTALNPHNQLIKEIELLVSHGMGEFNALQACTCIPAKLFGLDTKVGSLDVGKFADILVVRGNPLTNIFSLENALLVIKGGQFAYRCQDT